ncbi:hypothetical protein MHYP_G00061200 [Metynnis hypsauchen]
MAASKAECFLRTHRCTLIDRVRNVGGLVDFLSQPRSSEPPILTKEMASEIRAQETKENKMREVYDYLNSDQAFELTLEWLQDNEPYVIKDLENGSGTDSEAPARKRFRSSAEAVDQTDSGLGTAAKKDNSEQQAPPNLKTPFTFAKVEKWVSALENSQNHVDELKKKLVDGQMEALKENLKDKKLKKSFCFSINEVKKIDSNRKLKSFLQSGSTEFPNLAVDLFFERDTELSPQNVRKQAKKPQRKPPKSDGEDDAPPEGTTVDMQQIVSANMQYDSGLGSKKVMVYTDPQTGERKIIVPDKKNKAAKKNLLKDTRIFLNYQMWVCGVQTAVLINPEERVIDYDPSFEATIKLCERLVLEVFVPTLVLFKNMQREMMLNSLITTTKDLRATEVVCSQAE